MDFRPREFITNLMTLTREALTRAFLDPRRSVEAECGHPDSMTNEEYKGLYERDAIAARVVDVMPDESWMSPPRIFEKEESEEPTPFEKRWRTLYQDMRGDSFFNGEEGNPIFEDLKRADKKSGIGPCGMLLIGTDDGKSLDQPVKLYKKDEKSRKEQKLTFLQSFDATLVEISEREEDESSPRFGQPIMYNITFGDPNHSEEDQGLVSVGVDKEVHWTRVIDLPDNLRMKPVLNRILDLKKLYGASAEMYWRGAFFGISIESDPRFFSEDFDLVETQKKIKDQMENWSQGLQRYLTLMGMSAKSLAPQVVDPGPQIEVQIEAICIKIRVPKRIFMGSERGELASTQDDSAWNDRLRERQNSYITPRIIIPFVDRLIAMGILPPPVGYSVVWPDLDSLTDEDKANIAQKRTEAYAKYVQGQCESIIDPFNYLTREMDYSKESAKFILQAVDKHLKDSYPDAEGEAKAGHIPEPPLPDPGPGVPIKMREGDKLVSPDGKKIT